MKGKTTNIAQKRGSQVISHWKPPSTGTLKINVDAAVKQGRSNYGVGMVLRDQTGKFCRARVICHAGEVGVYEAETKGVLEALN